VPGEGGLHQLEYYVGISTSAGAIEDLSDIQSATFVSQQFDTSFTDAGVLQGNVTRSPAAQAFPHVIVRGGSFVAGPGGLRVAGGQVAHSYSRIGEYQVWQASASRTVSTTAPVQVSLDLDTLQDFQGGLFSDDTSALSIGDQYEPSAGTATTARRSDAQPTIVTDAVINYRINSNFSATVSWSGLTSRTGTDRFRLEAETGGTVGAFTSEFAAVDGDGTNSVTVTTGTDALLGLTLAASPAGHAPRRDPDPTPLPLTRPASLSPRTRSGS